MAAVDMEQLLVALSLQSNERLDLPRLPGVASMCAVAMPEERSFDRWQEANTKAGEYGYVAVGIGTREGVERLQEHIECVDSWDAARALRRATSFELARWFVDRETDLIEDAGELPLGDWQDPDGPRRPGLWFPFENGLHLDPWWMGLIPAQQPWQVPLALAYGNWNDCPDPVVHAAVARHWAQAYGASLVATGPDTIEFLVERPPSSRAGAMEIAKEQYLYCTDIVDQGIGTISALGAALIGNSTWSFWWD